MKPKTRSDIRNIAVIAHVDHGKTTLVDSMLKQSGKLTDKNLDVERILDSNDLERERGITILAKNTAVMYKDIRINILDTPGHQDFGGEVERMLMMADGVLLLVDAAEGPLPQTRFVMQKALGLNLPVVVAINKIDRKDARSEEVLDEVYDLFIDIGASDDVIEFPVLYADGRAGIAHRKLDDGSTDLRPLFDILVDTVPPPEDMRDEPLIIHANNLGWDDYVGRLVIGRIHSGTVTVGQQVFVKGENDKLVKGKIVRLYRANGLDREEIETAGSGDIISFAGIDDVVIGDTVVESEETPAMPRITIDEPTLAMHFCANTGPYSGEDGKYVTSRKLGERLKKEAMINVAIKVEATDATDVFRVLGRGELQMAILVETMRREGFELMLSRPEVVTKTIDGQLHEPLEKLYVNCDREHLGSITELLGIRKARLLDMSSDDSRTNLTYSIPTRGLIGFQSEFLTETRGTGIMNTTFEGWIEWQGPISQRRTGALIADRSGVATPYALFHLQPRGTLFIESGTRVYEGMIIGETPNGRQIDVNVTKEKKLTNIRASGKDDAVVLSRPKCHTLESSIEFICDDELIEVTPSVIRLRKKILPANQRHRTIYGKASKG